MTPEALSFRMVNTIFWMDRSQIFSKKRVLRHKFSPNIFVLSQDLPNRFPMLRKSRSAAFAVMVMAGGLSAGAQEQAGVERQPLAERPSHHGETLFTTLPAAQTGIDVVNSYDDPRIWAARYEEFAFGSIGTGVAIGDYDGDGLPDVYLAGKAARGRLYRNLGDWRFKDVTEAAGVATGTPEWETGTAFADIDNDGDLDLYVCRAGAANRLYLNQGDGTFKEAAHAAGLDLADASVMADFADYDRDGSLDMFVQTNLLDILAAPRGQRDHLYHNRGDGTFAEVTDTAGIHGQSQGHGAIWWDPDENGWPDLYVGNDFVVPDQLYLNRGDGGFVDVINAFAPSCPYFAMGSDIGDVNNDGRLDLLVADMLPTSREQYVSGMLNMQAKTATRVPAVAAAQAMHNVLLLSTGTARFQEAAVLAGIAATGWSWSVRFEDLDEDGRVDLHVTNGMFRDFLDADFLARVNQVDLPARKRLVQAAPELRERNWAFRNRGDLGFEPVGAAWGLDHHGISFSAAFGDLDGDGDLDLIFSNYNAPPTVCRNDSAGTHRVVLALRGTASNRFGIGARVRLESATGVQVRQLTAARGYLATSEPIIHFGLGGDARIDRLTIDWPSGRRQVIEGLSADSRYVITEPSADSGSAPKRPAAQFRDISSLAGLALAVIETPVDEFAAQPLLPARQQSLGPSLAVADLDGDGVDDILVGGVIGQPRQLLLQVGPKHLAGGNSALRQEPAVADAGILVFEANGDGQPDLLVAKGGVNQPAGDPSYQPRLLYGRGRGLFDEAPAGALPPLPISAGPAVAADFDRDGQLDVFIGGRVVPGDYAATPRSALLCNDGGRFVDVTEQIAPGLSQVGHVQSALWTDVDQDGWLDLLVATHWGGIRCWRNQAGRGLVDVSAELGFTAAGSGWWNSIAAADFNGDGQPDYAVGNLGLNTRYRASPEAPVVLLAGTFDASGRKHLIETETVDGQLFPIRARDTLLTAIPTLRRRAPSYHAYARSTAESLLGTDQMAAATRLEVTELRSGVFLSEGTGSARGFRFVPLPRAAQIAPLFGLVAGDFDGDGRADLYAVQNTHAPHDEIGRFAGGVSQLLRGDGHGGFTCASPEQSGLVVSGEARALAVKDFDRDGWPDFIVSRPDATTLAFLNNPQDGRAEFSIQLAGTKANPAAIGARITVVHQNGMTQTAEVHAGSGYLSQSSTATFFGFPSANPPLELHVQWPDGRRSLHAWRAGAHALRIAQPSATPAAP